MRGRSYSSAAYLTGFLAIGFAVKIIGEAVHEVMGHGLFVLAYGGSIQGVNISLLWPYELSSISWNLPLGLTETQLAMIYGGGIIVSLLTSFLVQGLLLLRRLQGWVELTLFWFAFWCLLNATGYLIVGGLYPFGDMQWLVSHAYIAPLTALAIGTVLFLAGYMLLLKILTRNLLITFHEKKVKMGTALFSMLIPLIVALTILGRSAYSGLALLPLAFIPVLITIVLEYRIKKKA